MNKKMLMLMANNGKSNERERRRRMGVTYEDWTPQDRWSPYMPPCYDDIPTSQIGDYPRSYPRYPGARHDPRREYNEPEMGGGYYPGYPTLPIYEDESRKSRMNPIGFARDMGGSDATMPHYQNEMERMEGGGMARGYSGSEYAPRFDREIAEEWMSNLQNEDGTMGPHWSLEQAKQVMAQKEIGGSPIEFWAALNATYSDLCKIFKKYGINNMDAYVDFAKTFWLDDKDSVPDKLAAYYEYVVKR